jgi:hypothetical protein
VLFRNPATAVKMEVEPPPLACDVVPESGLSPHSHFLQQPVLFPGVAISDGLEFAVGRDKHATEHLWRPIVEVRVDKELQQPRLARAFALCPDRSMPDHSTVVFNHDQRLFYAPLSYGLHEVKEGSFVTALAVEPELGAANCPALDGGIDSLKQRPVTPSRVPHAYIVGREVVVEEPVVCEPPHVARLANGAKAVLVIYPEGRRMVSRAQIHRSATPQSEVMENCLHERAGDALATVLWKGKDMLKETDRTLQAFDHGYVAHYVLAQNALVEVHGEAAKSFGQRLTHGPQPRLAFVAKKVKQLLCPGVVGRSDLPYIRRLATFQFDLAHGAMHSELTDLY